MTQYGFLAALALALAACNSGGSKEAAQPAKPAAAPADEAGSPARPAAEPEPALAKARPDVSGDRTAAQKVDIPNALVVDGMLLGGQPTDGHLAEMARAGYRTVINLQAESEEGAAEERAKVEKLGMKYVSIPIADAEALTEANARALDAALADASSPVAVHCKSGNRVGALLALRAHHVGGASPEAALAEGERTGLTSLAPAVRERLGVE